MRDIVEALKKAPLAVKDGKPASFEEAFLIGAYDSDLTPDDVKLRQSAYALMVKVRSANTRSIAKSMYLNAH